MEKHAEPFLDITHLPFLDDDFLWFFGSLVLVLLLAIDLRFREL